MMDSRIRFARHEDLPGVQRLYKELRPQDPEFSPQQAQAQWSHVLAQPHIRIVVAEHDGLLAATCMLALVANFGSGGRPIGLIEHVITLTRFRGRGLAAAVIRFALDFAWTHDCCKVMLLSGARRNEAHRLYESLGFRGDAERGFVIKPEELAKEAGASSGHDPGTELRRPIGVRWRTAMPLLFSYGTLQQSDVQLATFGRLLSGTADSLVAYEQSMVAIDDPEVVRTSGKSHHPIVRYTGAAADRVAGTVFEITADELERADRYEVSAYRRVAAPLSSGRTAWVYVDARFAPPA